ncbi:MAG: hypothetical protein C4576_07185 [Desulfobacteraceae bacterium]|nr:MAG: hypothetical protein C4576_07185 [Desulfobacteraceae bacterium]
MHQVDKRIEEARRILSSSGSILREDREIDLLVSQYRNAIEKTRRTMEQEGISRVCALCDRTSRGGCCYQGVEEWYDWTLLAVNILLGSDIPATREIPGACLFVGHRGCRLVARHAFCVNFFCPDLTSRLNGEPRSRFDRAAGEELLCGLRLEHFLRLRVASIGSARHP